MDFRRKTALLMAGCLVLGGIRLTGFTVQATQTGGNVVACAEDIVLGTVTDGDGVSTVKEGNSSAAAEQWYKVP